MRKTIELRRVVVTGMGVVTPLGNEVGTFWNNLIAGKNGIDYITRFDTSDFSTRFGGEVKDFQPENSIGRKEARHMDRFTQYAMVAAEQAIDASGLEFEKENKDRIGVIVSSGIGGMETFEAQTRTLVQRGPKRISPFFIPMLISDIAPGHIAMRYGLKGPNYSTISACASSSHALGDAFRTIQFGTADIMVAGGAEAAITPLGIGGFNAMKALSTRNETPHKASRPFDTGRDGFVLGEGSGIVVLESMQHAIDRGAAIIAEIAGIGYTADAYHITAPAPGGEGASAAIQLALQDSQLTPVDIDYINTHGTSTRHGDIAETKAIKRVFGRRAYELHVNSTKSMIGHLLGASGGVEFIVTALSLRKDLIHPTINLDDPDPECDLNYTANKAQQSRLRAAISNSFGFGGHNVAIVLKSMNKLA